MSKSQLFFLIGFFFINLKMFAQVSRKDSTIAKSVITQNQDSLKKTKLESLIIEKADSLPKKPFKIIPKLATKKSAVFPGWGQAYIKQYWFIPVIYAGFGASTFGILYNSKRYRILRKAYFQTSAANKINPAITQGQVVLNNTTYNLSIDNLRQYTNYFRRNRDVSWLSIPVVWAINILEVNVAAHLKSFDMTDDITLKLEPSFDPTITGMPILGAKMVFAFK
jgi:Family of unknown function (DUF5683)